MTAPDPRPRSWQPEAARRLSPGRDGSRTLRWTVLLLGLALVVAAAGSLATVTWVSAAVEEDYVDVPARYELGSPESLVVSSDLADVTVIRDPEAAQVTAALVEPGTTALPTAGETVQARVSIEGSEAAPTLDVEQTRTQHPVPWMSSQRDLLLVVPADLELALEATTSIGDIEAEGAFSRLGAQTTMGDIDLADVTVSEDVAVGTEVGDVDLSLAAAVPGGTEVTTSAGDATVRLAPQAEGDLTVTTDLGDIEVAAPGSGRYAVQASTDLGERSIDPDVMSAEGEILGTLTLGTSSGDVRVSR